MLKITLHDSSAELRFHLEGKLSGPWVTELRQCWETASSTTAGRQTVLDLGEVDFVDGEGRRLLAEMHRRQVRLQAVTPLIRSLVDEISRVPGCATFEEQPAAQSDAFVRPDSFRRNTTTL
jgi:anti-anti-sigma regulatory factor